jgi:hypothetical protein
MMSAYTRGQQYCIPWSIIKQLIYIYLHKNREHIICLVALSVDR